MSTDHYGLEQLVSGDHFSDNGYKYTNADRALIDRLLYLGAEGHHHNGEGEVVQEPTGPPTLSLSLTGGLIPAGTRVYYKFSLVDEAGFESRASTEAFVDTPAPVGEPGGPILSFSTTGGSLTGGGYHYVLTAYVGSSIAESKAINPNFITVPVGTNTNRVILTFPSLPAGATGFNIYRRKPGQTKYFYLDSVNMLIATPPTNYIDTGVPEDCDRTLPTRNTTNGTNSVTITFPGATPSVPYGYTWKIYRTYVTSNYSNSLLHHVVEFTSETTPVITTVYVDVGAGTFAGEPLDSSQSVGSPTKIMLTDMAEVQGSLPLSGMSFPFQVTFNYAGPLIELQGSTVWTCEFLEADIIYVRAALGRGRSPVAQDVVVDINKGAASLNPSFSSIFSSFGSQPKVVVGNQNGVPVSPAVTALARGDQLTMDIDQVGGGATPSDRDLTVTVLLMIHSYPEVSYTPGASGGTGGPF